jgi:tetrahedral aminopeptidase
MADMREGMFDLIKLFAETDAPSGAEAQLAELIASRAKPHADEVKKDLLGNVLVQMRGTGARLLLTCRMDEPGFCVTHVDQRGYLRFGPVGAIPPVSALGTQVRLSSGALGVIREEKRDSKTEPAFDRMYIDLGARDEKDAGRVAKVGDLACLVSEVREHDGILSGKVIATRSLCAALVTLLEGHHDSPNDVLIAFTVQGELAGRGGSTASYEAHPSLAIILDSAAASDGPEVKAPTLALRKGPGIRVKDSQILTSPQVRELLQDLAGQEKIPYQPEVSEAPALDARTIQNASEGTLLGVLSLPVRYPRTPYEIIASEDLENLLRLLRALLACDLKEKGF